MLSTRNFLKLANITRTQHFRLLNRSDICKPIHTSSWLCQQSKDQQSAGDNPRIYYGTLTPNITSVKLFSLTTSVAGVVAQPILYEQADKLGSSTPVIVGVCGFVGFFTFVTPFLLHTITKRYVTEMTFDPQTQEYTATTISFFLRKSNLKFRVEDVTVPEVPGMFTTFVVKEKGSSRSSALFVDPKLFDDPQHYVKLMGFDKPIDFRMSNEQKKTK